MRIELRLPPPDRPALGGSDPWNLGVLKHVTRTRTPLLLTAMAAIPLGTALIANGTPSAAHAAVKMTATPVHKVAAKPKKKTTHKRKKTVVKATATAKPKPTATPRPTSTPTAVPTSGQFSGPTVNMRWGPVQVTITVENKKITESKGSVSPDTARSQFLDDHALPLLRTEVLRAQSANIDTVSGATMTSDAYIRSLQGALAKAGL
jgi:uncharacterized protein with FMN-binding domain